MAFLSLEITMHSKIFFFFVTRFIIMLKVVLQCFARKTQAACPGSTAVEGFSFLRFKTFYRHLYFSCEILK